MTQEEILYKKSKTGTTVFYFAAGVDNTIVPFLQEPAYVQLNGLGGPDSFHIYSSGITELWTLQSSNNYLSNVLLTAVTNNYVTGYSFSETFNKILSTQEQQLARDRFYNNVVSTITGQTLALPSSFQTYVFFDEHEVDDMFANIKLSRTFNTLDTLSIYNKPVNSIPQQEARTGILFGKLQAIQTLRDEVGNNIRIPLRNVPVGIFNPTEEFPAPMSLDENGDRFFMNLKEYSDENQYFNNESFEEDKRFLRDQSNFLTVPEKYKYITTTNENGEFVIYNAPIGSQTLVFEVDLFKQGLTKDEIILNNFPFPTNDDSNIGEFPCYYYNQVPVDIVPAWGNNQSGYTELNVNVNLDLRKWATYIFAPASYGNEKLEVTVAKNITSTFKVQVRDMTNEKFASKTLETVQIPNDLDRAPGSQFLWFNEILDQRRQLEYFKFGCHVLKLPANLYDPNGFKTDKDGIPTNSRGVWLAAYQFRTFVNIDRCFRDTGSYLDPAGNLFSHFSVSKFDGALANDAFDFSGIGKFPYEKPWTINYPEPYKIAKKPIQKRFDYGNGRLYQNPYIVEEPPYSDGDLVGNVVDFNTDSISNVGGFGVQSFGGWFPNQIAYVATKDYMYKYEKDVSTAETFSNGYEPYWTQTNPGPYATRDALAGMSSVNNGEKYQRVECGYGYFMKYQDWPRVFRVEWSSDIYFYPDAVGGHGISYPGNYFGNFQSLRSWRHNVYNLDDQNFAFGFDQFKNNRTNKGGIDIYRIVNSGLDNIKIPKNFLIPTYIRINFGGHTDKLWRFDITNGGVIDVKLKNVFNSGTRVVVQNPSGGSITFNTNQEFTLNPGGLFYVDDSIGGGNSGSERLAAEVEFTGMDFPGNNSFNSATNKYDTASYVIGIAVAARNDSGGHMANGTKVIPVNVPATTSKPNWYINTETTGGDSGYYFFGIGYFGYDNDDDVKFWNIHLETSPR